MVPGSPLNAMTFWVCVGVWIMMGREYQELKSGEHQTVLQVKNQNNVSLNGAVFVIMTFAM